jgi:hypothetical protein
MIRLKIGRKHPVLAFQAFLPILAPVLPGECIESSKS